MKKKQIFNYGFTCLLLIVAGLLFFSAIKSNQIVNIPTLNSQCPPGFRLNEKNECIAQNLYGQYYSPNNKGVGGLKTALPAVRDGFSPQEIDLGRYLFFDPILSGNGKMACASCHDPKKGFSDGLATSVGNDNHKLTRAAPSLWNVAYQKRLFWDARASSLEEQMNGPLYSPDEMNNTPENLLKTINGVQNYKKLFSQAFHKKAKNESIKLEEIYRAITAFEASLISLNSKYDQYAHGFHEALNDNEIEGLNVFRSFVARCAECHTPPLFSNQEIAVIGSPEPNGLPLDPGAEIPFKDKSLRGGFKVPSLRNIEKTAPYMHSGNFSSLRETIQFYTDGRGHAVPKDENLILHWHIWEPKLTNTEMDRIVDFLKALTDESFMPKEPLELPSGLKRITNS